MALFHTQLKPLLQSHTNDGLQFKINWHEVFKSIKCLQGFKDKNKSCLAGYTVNGVVGCTVE